MKSTCKLSYLLVLLVLSNVLFFACTKDGGNDPDNVTGPDLVVYALTADNELTSFNANTANSVLTKTPISGLGEGEKLLSIDFRPATGELYALSDASRVYAIHTSSAKARVIGSQAFTPALTGSIASIDFNPTVDRIRIVTNDGQNLRIHPETGALVQEDKKINGNASPSITGVAYTNSVAGATSTTLYDIDGALGKLYKQDPPNDGTLVEVGSLGITFPNTAAFDISPDNLTALLAVKSDASQQQLFTVNLESGKAEKIGNLGTEIISLAIPTDPTAYAIDNTNKLHIFNPEKDAIATKDISGLRDGETLLGIDFRPANGQLYALGSSSRLYTINLGTGAATAVNSLPFLPLLSGSSFGFDFNPTVDRIRIISNTRQNLRIHPETAAVTIDGSLNPQTAQAGAAAYTNNFAGSTATTLFVIDHHASKLYIQNPPNDGTLNEVGELGISITASNGFDIGSASGKAYLIATVGSSTKLYSVNTETGAATAIRDIPTGVTGFAVGLGF